MRFFFSVLLLCGLVLTVRGQDFLFPNNSGNGKPLIDTAQLNRWPTIWKPALSPNGQYVVYSILNSREVHNSGVVKSVSGDWRAEFAVSSPTSSYWFSSNNQYLFISNNNQLRLVSLSDREANRIIKVKSSKWPKENPGKWLAYNADSSDNELILLNLENFSEMKFPQVHSYRFDDQGRTLLLETRQRDSLGSRTALKWINLSDGTTRVIWYGLESEASFKITNMNFDETGQQLVFVVGKVLTATQKTDNTIWYYRAGMDKSVIRVNNESKGIEHEYSITGTPRFSKNGKWIFFDLQPPPDIRQPFKGAPDVLIWGYKDPQVQPEQLRRTGNYSLSILKKDGPIRYAAAIQIEGGSVVQLEHDDEALVIQPNNFTGDFVLLADRYSLGAQYWWHFASQPSFYIVSLKDGSRKLLRKNVPRASLDNFSCSPNGRYLVFWDDLKANYFCYDDVTGKIMNVTGGIPNGVTKEAEFTFSLTPEPVAPVAGWHKNDSSLLIYDQYDIWLVHPQDKMPPVNITGELGKKGKIKFQLVYGPAGQSNAEKTNIVYNGDDTLLLVAFNTTDKSNGFYRKRLGSNKSPERLTMNDYLYYRTFKQIPDVYISGPYMQPIKAATANAWIVLRQSSTEFPNLFLTKDFKKYDSLTDYQPQKSFNWLTAELHEWKLPDGKISQGILYKPENFDPKKKYPVIFSYYKQLSHQLNEFPGIPAYSSANVNIPWFVSNGYLVFRPDIHYSMIGQTDKKPVGVSAYNAIVSAAQYLSKLPFVDGKKMGLQGHSVGGGETNYIISHSGLFAAAAEFAGVSDPVSNFLLLTPFIAPFEHSDKLSMTEAYSGATLWEQPNLYRNGSTVLNADKISTPLLITHNEKDNQISGRQGIMLYMALRRLGKPVWLLQYANGDHAVEGVDALDYTIRLTQFFNYYLKGELPPKWMTEGVPATLKGIEMRYELDNSGKKP